MNGLSQIFRKLSLPIKTGQTTSYGSGAGVDDGATQTGESPAFVVLSTGQYSGTTAITINSKTDAHSNNVVIDLRNRRMWSRYPAASVGPASNGLLPWTTNANGEGIFPYVAAANAAALAGHNDWRIPNQAEYPALYNIEAPDALPDVTYFPALAAATHWTSNTTPNNTANGQTAGFGNGSVSGLSKTNTARVMLVRTI